MPTVDLETLLCGGGDRKVACETQISAIAGSATADPAEENPDLPPESVLLSIREYILWTKLNKVLDRGESTIGNANPKSSRSSSKPKSGTQWLAGGGTLMKPSGPIIGLPGKIHPFGFPNNAAGPPKVIQIFPGKISIYGGRRKPAVPEPRMPKVSSFGSSLSEKESISQRSDAASEKWAGCWSSLVSILWYRGGYPPVAGENCESKGFQEEKWAPSVPPAPLAVAEGLSSERRPGSWTDDVDVAVDGHVLSLEPLDRESASRI